MANRRMSSKKGFRRHETAKYRVERFGSGSSSSSSSSSSSGGGGGHTPPPPHH